MQVGCVGDCASESVSEWRSCRYRKCVVRMRICTQYVSDIFMEKDTRTIHLDVATPVPHDLGFWGRR